MPIRLPDIPNLATTASSPDLVDTGAATAPARALGSVAQGIANVSGAFADEAERIQRMENARIESGARQQWMQGWGQLQAELENDPDPASHIRRTDEFLQSQKATLDQPDMSEGSRAALSLQYDDFATRAKNAATGNAANLANKRAALTLTNELEDAERTGNAAQFERGLKTAQDAGIVLPEQATKLRGDFQVKAAYNTLAREIETDPIGTEAELNAPDALTRWKHLGEDNLDRLRRTAHIAANRERSELWDGILNRSMDEGTNSAVLSKDELQGMAEQGLITAEQRASYLRAYHSQESPPFDAHIYNQAFAAITQYDPAQDPTGATIASLRSQIATVALPKEHVAELRDRLNERVKPANPTAHKLAGDFAKLTETDFNLGRFGNWFTYGDHDNDPRTMNRKIINREDYGRALTARRRFSDTFGAWLRNQPENADPVTVQKTYDELFERIVLDSDDPGSSPSVPGAPAVMDFGSEVDKALGNPPETGKETSAATAPGTFGGQRIQPAGVFYRNTRPTIFGGPNDPADNGRSAFGGATGAGGREGVAIPQALLEATFPDKGKDWYAKNVRAVVKTSDGRQAVFPVADLGTAEWVWQRDKRPVLDLTEGAVRQLGGQAIYKDGKLQSVAGLGNLSFALTTANAGTEVDLAGIDWDEAQDLWFKDKKPTTGDQIASGLSALRSAWLEANVAKAPWGDGTGGSVLPDYPNQ